MAVAHDVSSESHGSTTGHTGSASFTWNHAGGGSARGALVFVCGVVTDATPPVTSVTYGGVTMTAIPYIAKDTDTEPGQVTAYYLDNCGTGTKAVVVNRSDATPWAHILYATCSTVTAASATEVYLPGVKTYGGSSSNTAASTSGTSTATTTVVSITDGSPGTNSLRFACRYTGAASPGTAATGSTVPVSIDFTAYGIALAYQNTPSQGAADVGFTSAADDTAIVALAVREIPPILVQPAAAAVTIGTATPAVVAQNYILVQPAAATVSVATATPAVGTPVTIAPAAAAVTIGTATPTVVAQNWPKAQPAAAAIGVAGATPTVVGQNWPKAEPAAAAITIGAATPAVFVQTTVAVGPDPAALVIGPPTAAGYVTVTTIQDGYDLQSEVQQITVAATDGTWGFTSWVDPTRWGGDPGPSGLAWDISGAALDAAIHAWGGGNEYASVAKIGNVYTVTFNDGGWALTNIAQVAADRGGTVVTLQNGGSQNEIQQITVVAMGGTWDLHLQWWFDLLDIPWDISAADLESQLETLMDLGDCLSITKLGSVYTVEFIGPLGVSPQDQMTADGSNLVGGAEAVIVTVTDYQFVAPTAAEIAISGATPAVTTLVAVAPAAVEIAIAGATPAVGTPVSVAPGAAAVAIAGATPAVVGQNYQLFQPAAADLTIGTATPAIVAQNYQSIQMAAAAVMFAGMTPAVAVTTDVWVMPDPVAMVFTGLVPIIAGAEEKRRRAIGGGAQAVARAIEAEDEEILLALFG